MQYGLDLAGGASLFKLEMYGDWYRDPWSWPEIGYVARKPDDRFFDLLLQKSPDGIVPKDAAEFRPLQVPKSFLGVRPAVVMSVSARLLFLTAVSAASVKLQADLAPWVYGWRVRNEPTLSSNDDEWDHYVEVLNNPVPWDHILATDITSFFASINVDRMSREVYGRLGSVAAASLITNIVERHDQLSGYSGLPQRSWGSAVLANIYLRPVDDLISAALASDTKQLKLVAAARWMDDLYLVGEEGRLYELNLEINDRLRQLVGRVVSS